MTCYAPYFVCNYWNHTFNDIWKYRINGGIYLYPTQIKRIFQLIEDVHKTNDLVHVCESGFGAGHFSSMVLLLNYTKVTSFDIFKNVHQLPLAKKMQREFGHNRFNIIQGDTRHTIPHAHISPCHVIHISVPKNEAYDIVNFYGKSLVDTIVTATSLNKDLLLYTDIFPDSERLQILRNVSCEKTESVNKRLFLRMSVRERENQMHCWGRYGHSFALSRTVFEFGHRILMSKSGRGDVLLTGAHIGNIRFNQIAQMYKHRIINLQRHSPWVLLWVHHPSRDNITFCDLLVKKNTTTITYILLYAETQRDLHCLFERNWRIYTVLSVNHKVPNKELLETDNIENAYIFATYGNDIPIPDEMMYFENHRQLSNFKECPKYPQVAVPSVKRKRIHRDPQKPNLIVILLDAVSITQFTLNLRQTRKVLKNFHYKQIMNYQAVGEYSGPNQMALYKRNNEWLWDELTRLGYATMKIENSCIRHSALMKFAAQKTTHGREFFEYFCSKKFQHDCIGNITSLDGMLNISNQFLQAYDTFAAFIHIENMHEDSMTHARYSDEKIARFIHNLPHKNSAVVIVSDHGLHYGAYSNTVSGYLELWKPFAFHTLNNNIIMNNPHSLGNAIREYLHLPNNNTNNFKIESQQLRESDRPCRMITPSSLSFFGDTNTKQSLVCEAFTPKFYISNNTLYFFKKTACLTHRIHEKECTRLDFTNEDRYIVVNKNSIYTLPVTPSLYTDDISILVIEIDSLSRNSYHRFFPNTKRALSQLDVSTNIEYSNFNVIGSKSIPNQAALLSYCFPLEKCKESIFEYLGSQKFKTFFGEELCYGQWTVRQVLNVNGVDTLLDSSYCHLNETFTNCLTGSLVSKFALEQLSAFTERNANKKQFAFLNLIPFHNVMKEKCTNWFECFNTNMKVLNSFDYLIAKWVKNTVNNMNRHKKPFILLLKGDHGFREDKPTRRKFSDNVEHINPFLQIISNTNVRFPKYDTLMTPLDLYDFFKAVSSAMPAYDWQLEDSTCTKKRIPDIFCRCPKSSEFGPR